MESTSKNVTIGNDVEVLGDFSAYKAIYAVGLMEAVEGATSALAAAVGDFRRSYGNANMMEISRAEARRQFAPEPLVERERTPEGIKVTPLLVDGSFVMGPDPLGHLTDADWEACGHALKIPGSPSDDQVTMIVVPLAFRLAREQVTRLLALALITNDALEEAHGRGGDAAVEQVIDEKATRLMHRCTAAQLIDLAVAVINQVKTQVVVPFARARTAIAALMGPPEYEDEQEQGSTAQAEREAPPQQPASVETDSSPTLSTSSPDATDGHPTSASTAPPGP